MLKFSKNNNFLEEKYFLKENEEFIWDIHEYSNFLNGIFEIN
jgi:hypothetical protein